MYVRKCVCFSSMLVYMDTNCKKWVRGRGFGKPPFKNEKLASVVTSFTTQWEVYMLVP